MCVLSSTQGPPERAQDHIWQMLTSGEKHLRQKDNKLEREREREREHRRGKNGKEPEMVRQWVCHSGTL